MPELEAPEVDDEAADDKAEEVVDAPAVEAAPRRLPLWAIAAMVLLAAIAVVTSVIAANASADRRRTAADRAAVADTSGRLATALSTYDYRSFDATKKRVLAMSTGTFAGEYEKAVAALAAVISETKATSQATVSEVFVNEISNAKAKSIAVVDIQASGVAGSRVSVDNYVELSLVKVEGTWKVDGVSNLNMGVASTAAAGSTTTVPAAQPGTASTATTVR